MTDLLTSLSAFFYACTPERSVQALAALVEAYRKAEDEQPADMVSLTPTVFAKFRELAEKTGVNDVDSLLATIAGADPLMEQIRGHLAEPEQVKANGIPEIIIRPEKPVARGIARIGLSAGLVTVMFPEKREDFRVTIKGNGYEWDEVRSHWRRTVSGWTQATNVAAETGHRLLATGFWVAPPTAQVRDLITDESFEPECRRKVMVRKTGEYAGWLVLWWARSEDCYAAAKRISGSRYDKPHVVVPPEYYDEVEDFAGVHGFYVTPAAQRAIEQAGNAIKAALLVEIDNTPDAAAEVADRPYDLPLEIDDDLADDL